MRNALLSVALLLLHLRLASSRLLRSTLSPADSVSDSQADTVNSLREFVASSPDKVASLVLIGDSSVRGLVDMLLSLTSVRKVYTSSDLVKGSTQWHEPGALEDAVGRIAIQRAQETNSFFKDSDCALKGAIETSVFDKPLEGLVLHYWTFLPEISDACWKPCMTDMVRVLKPNAVLWNIGLHLLSSRYDLKNCELEHGKVLAKPACGHYEELVTQGMEALSSVTPTLIWRTTNWACWDKLISKPDWHDPVSRDSLEDACHKECPLGPYSVGEFCYDHLLDAHGTGLQYNRSMRAVTNVQKQVSADIHVLDAFAITHENCDAAKDGLHYPSVDDQLARSLASILSKK